MNCEYLVLKGTDGINTSDEFVWNISPNYYSNQRASVCFVSLHEINFLYEYYETDADEIFDKPIVIRTNLGLQNQQVTDNNLGVLGFCSTKGRHTSSVNIVSISPTQSLRGYDSMKLLTSARPSNIKIKLEHQISAGDFITASTQFILKFEYQENNTSEYLGSFQKTL